MKRERRDLLQNQENQEQTEGLNHHSPVVQRVLALRKRLPPQVLTKEERRRLGIIHHATSVFPDEFPDREETKEDGQGEKLL